ncbi:MAG: efflux RND transporter periplasmic adaptor subunit [Angelakisella sp.]
MKQFLMRTIAIGTSLLLGLTGCSALAPTTNQQPATVDNGILVTAALPERGSMELTTAFVGTIQPSQVVSVMPKLMGVVREVHVTTGQQVKKGDLLLTLDDKDVLPSYNQAVAGYNSAKAQVQQMTGSSYKSSLAQLDSAYDSAFDNDENAKYALVKAEGELTAAQQELATAKQALTNAQGEIPPDPGKISKAVAAVANAEARVGKADLSAAAAESTKDMTQKYFNNARNSYNAMKTDGQVELQAVADATLKQAEAGLNVAKAQLENTKLYSPIDGVVESISATPLNMVSNSTPAFVISNKDALTVTFNVPSTSIAAMEAGGGVHVVKGTGSYDATITEVTTVVNPQTALFTVKATLNSSGAELLTGVSVKVTAATRKAENAILLLQDSVYYDDGQAYVYLAVDGIAKKTPVETGISNPEKIEILSGIADTDMVVTSWHPNLIDGAKIQLTVA